MLVVRSPDPVSWLISSAVGGVVALCAVAWLYDKTRRRVDHPELGELIYHWGCWRGLRPHYDPNLAAVSLEIPGNRAGPNAEDCDRVVKFWDSISETVSGLRAVAIEEFRDLEEDGECEAGDASIEEISAGLQSDEASFDRYWQLSQVSRIAKVSSPIRWTLDFEVVWDIEHTRTAFLDDSGNLLAYNLTCVGSGLDDEDDL